MIIFYKAPVIRQGKPIVKSSFKKSRRAIPVKKLTKNNKEFLRALGYRV